MKRHGENGDDAESDQDPAHGQAPARAVLDAFLPEDGVVADRPGPGVNARANLAALAEKVKAILGEDGGSVVKSDAWGMRKLGYPINKLKEGQYVHLVVALKPQAVMRVESRLRLNEDIIRHLLVAEEAHAAPVASEVAPDVTVTATEPAPGA